MSRLQQKCLVASTAMHGLLLLVVLVAPLILLSDAKKDDLPVLKVIPGKLVDELMSGGGSPTAKPPSTPVTELPRPAAKSQPAPVIEPPKPAPEAEPTSKPLVKPLKERNKLVKPAPEPEPPPVLPKDPPAKPTVSRPRPQIKVDTKIAPRTPREVADANAKAAEEEARVEARARVRAEAEARRQALQRFAKSVDGAADSITENLSHGTTIEMPGPGGEAYANYGQAIKTIYDQAWVDPDEVSDDVATVQVEIVVARDGALVSDKIAKRSGIPALDKSVQNALNRVRKLPPFPAGAKESKRTFIINFNLKAKRLLG